MRNLDRTKFHGIYAALKNIVPVFLLQRHYYVHDNIC